MDLFDEPAPLAGRMPTVPDGIRLYVVGDVHGRLDLLHGIERQIEADARSAGDLRIVQVMLGDYIDRGPDSRGVIAHLIERARTHEIVTLRGNHEAYMIELPADLFSRWCRFGGRQTLASYGLDLSEVSDAAIEASTLDFVKQARAVVPEEHMRFLAETQMMWRSGDYLFVHAGIRPGVPLAKQDPYDLMWIRHDFLDNDDDLGLVVVHGHTPMPAPVVRPNRIDIDTKAFQSGVLTCLVLEGTQQRFLQTSGAML